MIVAVFHSWSADFFILSCCLKRSKLSTLRHREVSYFGCWRCTERSFQRLCCHFRRSTTLESSKWCVTLTRISEWFSVAFTLAKRHEVLTWGKKEFRWENLSLLESWVDFYFSFQTLTWFGCKSSVIWSCGTRVFPWRCFLFDFDRIGITTHHRRPQFHHSENFIIFFSDRQLLNV